VIRICGIIGCVIRDPKGVRKNLRWIYTSQKERGGKGAGFSIYRPSAGTINRVRAKKPQKLLKHKDLGNLRAGDLLLFHHRLPTSTPNIEACNHPIVNEDGTLHLIHNGWVISASYHHDLLRKKGHVFETEILGAKVPGHSRQRKQTTSKKKRTRRKVSTCHDEHKGFESRVQESAFEESSVSYEKRTLVTKGLPPFSSFTDSEVIIHEFEEELVRVGGQSASGDCPVSAGVPGFGLPPSDGEILKALRNTIDDLYGELTFAFFIRGIEKIFIYRGTPPCKVYEDRRGNTWFSSEYPRVKVTGNGHTGRFRFLRNLEYGEAAAISLKSGYENLGIINSFACSYFDTKQDYDGWDNASYNQANLETWTRSGNRNGAGTCSPDPDSGLILPGPGVETPSWPPGLEADIGITRRDESAQKCPRKLDDTVLNALDKAAANVWESITDEACWYGMDDIPLSLVHDLLKAEVERTRLYVPETEVRKLAIDIWELL